MMTILTALGFVLVFEGFVYAIAPQYARKMADFIISAKPDELRLAGVIGLGTGVILLYLFY